MHSLANVIAFSEVLIVARMEEGVHLAGSLATFLTMLVSPTHAIDVSTSARSRAAVNRVTPTLKHSFQTYHLTLGSLIFSRVFKETSELELWTQGEDTFQRFKTYVIFSFQAGDQQSPKGFDFVNAGRISPFTRFSFE